MALEEGRPVELLTVVMIRWWQTITWWQAITWILVPTYWSRITEAEGGRGSAVTTGKAGPDRQGSRDGFGQRHDDGERRE